MGKKFHNILVNRIHDQRLKSLTKKYFKGDLIDIGCGIKPYQEMLKGVTKTHTGLDHELSKHNDQNVDLKGTAYEIPSESNKYDSALCTAVLEHLEEPEQALRECHRVLKEGGVAIYSMPHIWHLHEEPRDFYRYTKYGLKYLFEKTGFEVIEIIPLAGFWVTFGQLFCYYIKILDKIPPIKWLKLTAIISLPVQLIAYILDKPFTQYKWTWMYMVVARKAVK